MEQAFAALEERLANASTQITAGYFQLPVADADSVYRERVYCYELYHQRRCVCGEFNFSLGRELDKIGHPHFQDGPYARSKPDLLVDQPGNMRHNFARIEVKPFTGEASEFRDDLRKLTWFCHHAGYHWGLFIIYGREAGDMEGHRLLTAKLRRAVAAPKGSTWREWRSGPMRRPAGQRKGSVMSEATQSKEALQAAFEHEMHGINHRALSEAR